MTDAPEQPTSNGLTRWAVPGGIAWCGLLLSAWVYSKKLDEPARNPTPKLLIAFLGVPILSVLLLVILRWVARRASKAYSRHGDLLIIWVITFLFCIHAAVLAAAIKMFPLSTAVPICTALLMIGLGPVLSALEPGSAMGIRTRATLGSETVWRKTHRMAGRLFVLAGCAGFSALLFEGQWVLFASIVPAVGAVIISVVYAARQPETDEPAPMIEEETAEERPSG